MNTTMSKLALAVGALVMAGGAMAVDNTSATMSVNATIADQCAVGNTAALGFGALVMLTAGAQSGTASSSIGGGTFDVICTNGTNQPRVAFTSANAGAGTAFRLLGGTDSFIVYTLANPEAAIAYGTAADFPGLTADGTVKTLTITGSIAASEKAGKKVQAYSDTITIQTSFNL